VQIIVQPVSTAPVVDAGPDQTITLPADAALDGTVSDDGYPNPPGALTTTWSVGSGPGTVTFQNASAVDTRATFGVAGTYLLRLTASDGAQSTRDSVQVTVRPAPIVVERRVAASSDDAEEPASGGQINLTSPDLQLINDTVDQLVGIRFPNLAVPRGATITNAWIQFEATGVQTSATSLTIRAQAADNAGTFAKQGSSKISTRIRTTSSAAWAPVSWNLANEAGANQRTPDLTAVVQEIVNRTGWTSGNALAIIINGTGRRTAWAYDGKAASAPLLHIEYTTAPLARAVPAARGGAPGRRVAADRVRAATAEPESLEWPAARGVQPRRRPARHSPDVRRDGQARGRA
jgi:hypothetical protein